jgi:Ca2+-binding RTX toxin-like protein
VAAAALTTAHGGHVSLQADGSFTYVSASDFTGTDTFNYKLLDERGGQADGTVTMTVDPSSNPPITAPVNTPPIAQPDDFSGQENMAVLGNVLANNGHGVDTDPNGFALSVIAGNLATAHGGTAALNADGSFTYHPASNFFGTDSFTYTLNDTAGLSASGTASIAVSQTPSVDPTPTGPVIYGTNGNNTLSASYNTGTVIYGLGGNDIIQGHNGNDTLYGGDGKDKLYGSGGNDILIGGAGADTMTGGTGNDVFKYNSVSEGGDFVTDFHHLSGDTDTLDLTALFVANGLGSIDTATAIQKHYLVLSQHPDGLHVDFDRDSSGGAAAVHLVTLHGASQQHLDILHQILTASS